METLTFEQVQQLDAEYRRAAKSLPPPDPVAEGAALVSLFNNPTTCAVCASKLGERWQACLDQWQPWSTKSSNAGVEVLSVVNKLDAHHLLATSIQQRFKAGVTEACFGLATLLSNMRNPGNDFEQESGATEKNSTAATDCVTAPADATEASSLSTPR